VRRLLPAVLPRRPWALAPGGRLQRPGGAAWPGPLLGRPIGGGCRPITVEHA
jgi:hypothetical protein